MRSSQSGFGEIFLVATISFILVVALGESYSFVINVLRVRPWVGVVLMHGALAGVLYLLSGSLRAALNLPGTKMLAWWPAIAILVGALSLAVSTQKSGISYRPSGVEEVIYAAATLTVIPMLEEIVFRGGITPILSRLTTPLWSMWFSALVFSVAHTQPTWGRITSLKIGFVLGPFLLGICCDMIVRRWGRLWPAIAFHSACNGTIYIFSVLNPAWLTHFGGLYM